MPCTAELGFADAASLAAILDMYTHKDTPEEIKQALIDAFKRLVRIRHLRKESKVLEKKIDAGDQNPSGIKSKKLKRLVFQSSRSLGCT